MPELASRGNRRRRWWLRAQAALVGHSTGSRNASPIALAIPQASICRTENDWFLRWCDDARIPAGVSLRLRKRWTGEVLQIPLSDPCMLVGTGPECQVQLLDSPLSQRQTALMWVSGELTAVDMTWNRWTATPAVMRLTPRSRLRWGPWDAVIDGLIESNVMAKASSPEVHVGLAWSNGGCEPPSPVFHGLSLVGSASICAVRRISEHVGPIHAALLRGDHSVWVVDLQGQRSTRVNGRPIEFAPLDPGDVLGIGDQSAWLTVQWESPSTPNEQQRWAQSYESIANSESSQQFLLEQTVRLTQLQQRLASLLSGVSTSAAGETCPTALQEIQQLASECERRASQMLANGSTSGRENPHSAKRR